ncbi:copper transporter [Corynebacterium ulceribovis]|uniref:copper transporter n=1 Tax=Corynebacterium ulceribovis TaxID=487732 RepID=UPI000381ABB6|nr:copper transporter [Corynebacterium ulceribovis]
MGRSRRVSKSYVFAGTTIGVAAGLLLGTYFLGPASENRLHTGQEASSSSPAKKDGDKGAAPDPAVQAQADAADEFIAQHADAMVKDQLTDRPVMLLHTADADQADVDEVAKLLKAAGAKEAGRITLLDKFVKPEGGDELKSIVANVLPEGAQLSEEKRDPGTHAGQAMAPALLLHKDSGKPQTNDADRALVLKSLREAKFIDYKDGTVVPAQLAVIVTGDGTTLSDPGYHGAAIAAFATALDDLGNGVVVAGRFASASESGAVGKIRNDEQARKHVSTVDDVDTAAGRVATVQAAAEQLKNKATAFGAADNADKPAQ